MSEPSPETGLGPELPGMTCLEFIDSGGFADVFLYERHQPRGRVAVKLMKLEAVDDSLRRQFAAEADAMAELAEHPNIATVFGAGTAPNGRPYLVMQFYPRADLEDRVADTPLSVQEALRLGVQLSSAVETAHRAGIIHRDIKPSNILMTSFGQPVLSDFGIAGRPSDSEDADEDVGVSIPWSPPEVLTGGSNGSVTSDVYSLAATMWHLLVGRAPFSLPGGDNGERATVTRIAHSRPPATGRDDVPASLDRLLQQAMAKDPAYRPQTALELARHFQRVEQELRLARTEAVVLDQSGPATPRPRADELATSTSTAEVSDAVASETVVGSTPRTSAPDSSDSAATERKAPRRIDAAQEAAPESARRWYSAPDREPPTAEHPRPGASEDERRTERRPRVAVGAQTSQPPPEPTREPSPRRWPLLATGAVAVVAVVVGIVLSSRSGEEPQAHHRTTHQPVNTSLDDAVPGGILEPPTLVAHAEGSKIRFSWAPVTGASWYEWRVGDGSARRTTKTAVSVARTPGAKTCIKVVAGAPGLSDSLDSRRCSP